LAKMSAAGACASAFAQRFEGSAGEGPFLHRLLQLARNPEKNRRQRVRASHAAAAAAKAVELCQMLCSERQHQFGGGWMGVGADEKGEGAVRQVASRFLRDLERVRRLVTRRIGEHGSETARRAKTGVIQIRRQHQRIVQRVPGKGGKGKWKSTPAGRTHRRRGGKPERGWDEPGSALRGWPSIQARPPGETGTNQGYVCRGRRFENSNPGQFDGCFSAQQCAA